LPQVKSVAANTVSTSCGVEISASILIKCIGFETNEGNERLLGRTTMTCVGMVDRDLWVLAEGHPVKKELKPGEIYTVPDDPDGEDPPDKEWSVIVKVVTFRRYENVKAPDPYWAVEAYETYDYEFLGKGHEEVVEVEEEK